MPKLYWKQISWNVYTIRLSTWGPLETRTIRGTDWTFMRWACEILGIELEKDESL